MTDDHLPSSDDHLPQKKYCLDDWDMSLAYIIVKEKCGLFYKIIYLLPYITLSCEMTVLPLREKKYVVDSTTSPIIMI